MPLEYIRRRFIDPRAQDPFGTRALLRLEMGGYVMKVRCRLARLPPVTNGRAPVVRALEFFHGRFFDSGENDVSFLIGFIVERLHGLMSWTVFIISYTRDK